MSSLGKVVILHVLLLNVGFTFGSCPNGQYLNHSGVCVECSPCRGPDEIVIKRCHARNDTLCAVKADYLEKMRKKNEKVLIESPRTWKFMQNLSKNNDNAEKVQATKYKPRKNKSLVDKDGLLELSSSKISLDKNGKHIKKDLSSIDETLANSNQSSLQSVPKRKSVDGSKSSKKNKIKQKKNENSGYSEEIESQQILAHMSPRVVPKKEGKKPEKKSSSVELEGSFGMKKTIATVLQAASHLKNRTKFFEPIDSEYDVFKKNNIDDDDDDVDDDDDDIDEDDDSKNSEYDDDEEDDDEDDDDDDEEDDTDEDEDEESDKPKLKSKPLKGLTYDELIQSFNPEKPKLKSKPLKELTYDELVQSVMIEKPKLSFKPFGTDQDFPEILDNANDIDPETLVTQESKWPVVNEVNIEPFVDTSNWQLLILVAAATACLLFFLVVNAYVCIYLKKWRHMKHNFEADVEDLSVRKNLMQHAGFEVDETVYIKNYLTQLQGGKSLEK